MSKTTIDQRIGFLKIVTGILNSGLSVKVDIEQAAVKTGVEMLELFNEVAGDLETLKNSTLPRLDTIGLQLASTKRRQQACDDWVKNSSGAAKAKWQRELTIVSDLVANLTALKQQADHGTDAPVEPTLGSEDVARDTGAPEMSLNQVEAELRGDHVFNVDVLRKRMMELNGEKRYLGDGAYVKYDFDRQALVLTTENGIEATNEIVLEPEVLSELTQYIEKLLK